MERFEAYPLRFEPIFKEKIWGGRRIEEVYHKKLPQDKAIGESWELSDRFDDISIVSNGLYQNKNLHELLLEYPVDLLGRSHNNEPRFPILVKILDPNDKLSVQVHPPEEYVESHPKIEAAKTEMWYVVETEPGSEIILGNRPGIFKEDIRKALDEGTLDQLLNYVKVERYRTYPIFAGTIHALLPGTLLFEIQQNSDVTFRLYDWGRMGADGKPRPLHIEQGLDVINFNPQISFPERPIDQYSKLIFKCHLFEVLEYHLPEMSLDLHTESFQILLFVSGAGSLSYGENEKGVSYSPGETILIPAALGNYRINSLSDTRFLLTRPV